MTTQLEGKIIRSKRCSKQHRTSGYGIALFLLIGYVVACFPTLGSGGEPATADIAERVIKELVQALQSGDGETAYHMFSEKICPNMSRGKLALLAETDENWIALKTYQNLEVCDWGLIMRNDGHYLLAQGLLRYKDGQVVFESSLRKDSDAVWRIYELRLMPEMEPKSFGRCDKQ